MDQDSESTPIENILEIEQEHAGEANAALAELNGVSESSPSSVPPPAHQSPSQNPSMYQDIGSGMGGIETVDESMFDKETNEESMMDFWIQLVVTVVAVIGVTILFFSPKVRVMLEPAIGTGYMALVIRAIAIGVISIIPRLVLM